MQRNDARTWWFIMVIKKKIGDKSEPNKQREIKQTKSISLDAACKTLARLHISIPQSCMILFMQDSCSITVYLATICKINPFLRKKEVNADIRATLSSVCRFYVITIIVSIKFGIFVSSDPTISWLIAILCSPLSQLFHIARVSLCSLTLSYHFKLHLMVATNLLTRVHTLTHTLKLCIISLHFQLPFEALCWAHNLLEQFFALYVDSMSTPF